MTSENWKANENQKLMEKLKKETDLQMRKLAREKKKNEAAKIKAEKQILKEQKKNEREQKINDKATKVTKGQKKKLLKM
jgi:hypothetical protein